AAASRLGLYFTAKVGQPTASMAHKLTATLVAWLPAALAAAILCVSSPLAAQTVTGSMTGTIVDTQGGGIPGAAVTLVSDTTGASRTTTSNERGDFTFDVLQPDIYSLTIELSGFKKSQRLSLHLEPSAHLSVGQITLELGAASELVTVVAEGAKVQIASSER